MKVPTPIRTPIRTPIITRRYKSSVEVKPVVALHSRIMGTRNGKTPIVFLHGLFGNAKNWTSSANSIIHHDPRAIHCLDLRNHGGSPHALPHDYHSLAMDVITYLENHAPQNQFILAGHSMGAKTAMLVALLRPDLVHKLIVIDNSPVNQPLPAEFAQYLEGMVQVEQMQKSLTKNLSTKDQLKQIDAVLKDYVPDKLTRVFLASNLKQSLLPPHHHSQHHALSKMAKPPLRFQIPVIPLQQHSLLENMGNWPQLHAKSKAATLVLRGLHSGFVTDQHIQNDFPRYFSHFRVRDFDCGHWLVSERKDQFVQEVLLFIQ